MEKLAHIRPHVHLGFAVKFSAYVILGVPLFVGSPYSGLRSGLDQMSCSPMKPWSLATPLVSLAM